MFLYSVVIRKKSEDPFIFDLYKKQPFVLKYLKNGVKRQHSDGGGEYENAEANETSCSTPYTPQNNPFADRVNRSILEPIRVLLEQAGLSARY